MHEHWTGQLRLGAYALCVDDTDRLLLTRVARGFPVAGKWTLPGGGVELGEPPERAVLRELEEETGLIAGRVRLLAIYSRLYQRGALSPEPWQHLGIIYRVDEATGTARPEENGSTDGCSWFAHDDVATLPLTDLGRFGVDLAWPTSG